MTDNELQPTENSPADTEPRTEQAESASVHTESTESTQSAETPGGEPRPQNKRPQNRRPQKAKKTMLMPREQWQEVLRIAETLNETERKPIVQIGKVYLSAGAEFTLGLMNEALKIEEDGGLMLPDGSRRRTLGGIFFMLCRERLAPEARDTIFNMSYGTPLIDPETVGLPELDWDTRAEIFADLNTEPGTAGSMRVTLTGRPEEIVEEGDSVRLTIMQNAPLPTVPRSIPIPSITSGPHTVYLSKELWKKAEPQLKREQTRLLITGQLSHDADGHITIHAQEISSRQYNNRPPKPTHPSRLVTQNQGDEDAAEGEGGAAEAEDN